MLAMLDVHSGYTHCVVGQGRQQVKPMTRSGGKHTRASVTVRWVRECSI